jgi:hypothetical protein
MCPKVCHDRFLTNYFQSFINKRIILRNKLSSTVRAIKYTTNKYNSDIMSLSHTEYRKKRLDYLPMFVTGISLTPLICFISFSATEAIQRLALE